ncbi:MAG TPA: acyl carrier protein [Xanthobacteraceae bacterium]|nr:acyl carrier protein [Xanthobacteraceae bacterium]
MQQLDPAEAEIRTWCTGYLAETLRLPREEIDPNAKFARLGLDSAMAIFFLTAIEEWLGLELSAEIVFEHQTVADVARYLARLPEVATKLEQRAT